MMLANVRSFLVALFQFGKRRGEKAVTGRPGKRKARTELPLSKRRREERERKKKKKKKKGRLEGLGQHRRSESKPALFLSYNLHTFPADEMTLRNEDKGPFYQA